MHKIVVFDSGWGGELVADHIQSELPFLDIIRVIDWPHAPYHHYSHPKILSLIEAALRPYWSRVEAVVLAGYIPSLVHQALQLHHPEIKIVPMRLENLRWKYGPVKKTLLLADSRLKSPPNSYPRLYEHLQTKSTEIITPNCDHWTKLIDEGLITDCDPTLSPYLATNTSHHNRIDAVFLANTHFWLLEPHLIDLLGWQITVIDGRRELMHDLCRALGLRGVDGERNK